MRPASSAYFAGYTAFNYFSKLFSYHSDELCGYIYGKLQANPAARLAKTCTVQLQNSTFGKDQLKSMGVQGPATFPAAFWVVMDGFFPSELGIDANDNLTNPPNPPIVTFSVDPTNANQSGDHQRLADQGPTHDRAVFRPGLHHQPAAAQCATAHSLSVHHSIHRH